MSVRHLTFAAAAALALLLSACGDSSKIPEQQSIGARPQIPEPTKSLIPTVHIAKATGWSADGKPTAATGLNVTAFARGLDHPRWVFVLPNGDVLVAESNAPERPEQGKGVKGRIMKWAQSYAGAGVKSANRITLLRDQDGDGVAETRSAFMTDLNSPFGMALIGDTLYIANTDAVVKVKYQDGATQITETPQKVADLPAGPRNHHWTKNIIASRDGTKIYATSGSNSDHAENGLEAEQQRAAILEVDLGNGQVKEFATGLRNPNGMGWSASGELWTVVNERDELGSDLVPDYLTSVKPGGFYGWPWSYWGQHVDTRVQPERPDMVAKALRPDYALGNHVAPLGMAFAQDLQGHSARLGGQFADGVFVGEHGSWNRKPRSGYKVVFVPFLDGKPNGQPIDVLTGFVNDDDKALGRPVGVAIGKDGAVLVADDVGNAIWRVSGGAQASRSGPAELGTSGQR